ncbi:hypothetical protein PHYPSEUDO_004831 [Phytophthora pseudosyringae]|uniref:Tetratricopeptide repeat n=1 Tax=Phytophthora pseudosyringae TaxID=221518 RepID=A0A8T1VNL2_9STRA|nr:hypothetical protein PHYPSEUDO_004831 [Phytophthora pseudosyringae]
MSHFYHRDNVHEAAPRARSPKRNPFQTTASSHSTSSRDFPGNPAWGPGTDYSPTKMRAHLDRKQTSNQDSDQRLLEMLSSTVACLKQKNMDLEALGCLEQSLWLKRRMFGVDSSAVHTALNEVMLSYNSVAMQYLAQGQFDQCLAMLRKAEAITAPGNFKRCQALQILTFNNIGCCYRKLGKLKSALKYLKEAAQIGSGSAHVKNLSITHLNLCAIQSQLGRHDLALEHAQAAIFHTQEELVSLEDGASEQRDEDGSDNGDQAAMADALDPKTREEKIISLAVAYHNLAVELEFNGRGEASLQWYKKALQLVWKYRETNEALCDSFKKIFLDARKKQQTANVRQNGIPASASTANNPVNGRRPLPRPRSAHAASRCTNEVDRGDVSYSSTVASQCYKATKPSTAGLRYASPRGAAAARGGQPQRPASAATTRQRPMSAKPSTRANYRTRGPRDLTEDVFEMHWRKLEKEHDLDDCQTAPAKTKRKIRRPQSASSAATAARRRNQGPVETQRQQKLQGQLYFAALGDDIVGNDEDYGVIDDDGSSDDGFNNYPGSNQQDRESLRGGATQFRGGPPVNARKQRPSAAVGPRHRRTLDDSRSKASLEPRETVSDHDAGAPSSQDPEESSPNVSATGYSGDDDTDPDLPAQRVCHMEYLRRMKKLAESIKDDLNGVGIRPPAVKPVEREAENYSRSPVRRMDGIDPAISECGSTVSTPRSATSKLRDRIEQARRDSCENPHEAEAHTTSKSNEVQSATLVAKRQSHDDDGVELQEDVHVFKSEVAARDAELQLFREAAGCRLQAFFRGQHCRTEVTQLKQVKRENDSASMIQRQVRQYLEAQKEERRLQDERSLLELQKEEVEDMAACLIQRLCRRRAISQKHTSVTKCQGEDEKPCLPSQRRPVYIADVVLGAAVNKCVESSQPLLNQGLREPPHLNPAATVPHINLSRLQEPEAPRRSSTVSSFPLSDQDGVKLRTNEQTPRSEGYDDDEEWKAPPPHSAQSTPRRACSSGDNQPTTPARSVTATPRTTRSPTAQSNTPKHCSLAVTPRTSRNGDEEVDTRRQNAAAIRIQASIKSFAVRRRIALESAGDISRTYIERKHFNVALDRALALEPDFLEQISAIKIQALVRGRQSRLLTECIKAGVDTAASTIQRSFRVHRQNTHRAVDEGVRSIAARTIQQVFRDFEARRTAIHQAAVDEERSSVQRIAASTIQNVWRQYYVARNHSFEEIEAATCIQALGRGHLSRKSLKSLRGSSSSGLSKHSSAFSMSSSAEKLLEEDKLASARNGESLSSNYSFLPPSVRELFTSSSGNHVPRANSQIHAQEIAELGLTFADFLRELETCTEVVVGSSALDAMRIMVETSPGSTKTLANVVKVAQALDRRLQEGFWNETIEASSVALLHAFRDVLDTQ